MLGPYDEWWKYNYNFFEYNVPSLNIFSLNLNTKACAIKALKTCIMLCLYLAQAVLPSISPITAHQTTGFVKKDKSTPTKVLAFLNKKAKFSERDLFSKMPFRRWYLVQKNSCRSF
jgi:hypothetical protein